MADETTNSGTDGTQQPDLTAEVTALQADRDAQAAHVADLQSQLDTMTAERDAAVRDRDAALAERDALQAAATAAANEPGAMAVAVDKPRAVKPMDNPAPNDLMALIREAGSVQLAFSDGKREIAGLGALEISGDAWGITVVGVALQLPNLVISGPFTGEVEIAGYGLFIDTKQVAWAGRMDVLRVAPGQKMNITGDVLFGA